MSASDPISPLAQEMVLTCQRMLGGQLGVVAAARQIKSLAFRLHGDKYVHDLFRVFIAIDSETDHLPVGPERRHWAADALAAKDAEIQRYEESWRADAFKAARKIVQSYEKTIAELGAPPNGGPATRSGNSGVAEGPPSVS